MRSDLAEMKIHVKKKEVVIFIYSIIHKIQNMLLETHFYFYVGISLLMITTKYS